MSDEINQCQPADFVRKLWQSLQMPPRDINDDRLPPESKIKRERFAVGNFRHGDQDDGPCDVDALLLATHRA